MRGSSNNADEHLHLGYYAVRPGKFPPTLQRSKASTQPESSLLGLRFFETSLIIYQLSWRHIKLL
jgi:hypothetical protein